MKGDFNMVDLKTAIKELNTGIIEFEYPNDSGCTTEGEVVTFLKRLEEFEKVGLEPEEIKKPYCCCNIDYVMKINMWLIDTYKYDLLSRLDINTTEKESEKLVKLADIFEKIYEEENKKYPLPWYKYGFGGKKGKSEDK